MRGMTLWTLKNPRRLIPFLGGLLIFWGGAALTAKEQKLPPDWEGPLVSIFWDYDDGHFGRSLYRGILFSVRLSDFSRYGTLPAGEEGVLTAVTLSASRSRALAGLPLEGPFLRKTLRTMGKKAVSGDDAPDPLLWIWSYQREGLEFSFSLERPSRAMLDNISRFYENNPRFSPFKDEITTYYRENYVIRIHRAENITRPEIAGVTYADALLMASILGDKDQKLWGIHDGLDHLFLLLNGASSVVKKEF